MKGKLRVRVICMNAKIALNKCVTGQLSGYGWVR
jgi:hypothetical protein